MSSLVPWHLSRDADVPISINAQTALSLTAVYRACSLLADAASGAPVRLYSRPQSGGRVVDLTSAAARALETLAHADAELFAFSVALVGNGFLRVERDGTGAPFALRAIPPWRVSIEIEEGSGAVWYRLQPDASTGEPGALLPEADVIHAKYRCTATSLAGVPPMASCAPSFELALLSKNVQRFLFRNLATPGMVLVTPNKVEPDVAKALQAQWEANYRGPGAGRTAVLSNGFDVRPVIWKAADQQLLEQINASTQDIARAFGVPRQFLEDAVTMTYASASEGTRALYALALRGFCVRLADAIAIKLLSRNERAAGAGVEFDLSGTLILPGKEMSDYLGGLVSAGICTPNEVRNGFLGLPDLPGGSALRSPTHTPQGAKGWQRGVTYPAGSFVHHDAGLWQRSDHGDDEAPAADSAAWDCVAPGIASIEHGEGGLTVVMSSGHRKFVEV
jgi:HK97 family phage portal protein